jgi:hypothetical protein
MFCARGRGKIVIKGPGSLKRGVLIWGYISGTQWNLEKLLYSTTGPSVSKFYARYQRGTKIL